MSVGLVEVVEEELESFTSLANEIDMKDNTDKCRYWNLCRRYNSRDYFCNFTQGRHGVDLTGNCYEPVMKIK